MDRFSKARDVRDRRKKGEIIRKGRQSKNNDERLYFKFISKYIEGLHPMIYEDAVAFHNETKQKNPDVSDCTKTVEFISRVMPNTYIPRHYFRRQKRSRTQEMALQIPLLTNEQTLAIMSTTTTLPAPLPELQPVSEPELHTASESELQSVSEPELHPASESELQSVSEPELHPASESELQPVSEPELHTASESELHTVSEPELQPLSATLTELPSLSDTTPFPELQPEIFKEMLEEIQLDPQLSQIFNQFYEDDVCMDDAVWDDISKSNIQMF